MLDGDPLGGGIDDVEWESSNKKIATIENKGQINGKAKGTSNIKVTYTPDSISDTKTIRIKQPVTSVSLSEKTMILEPNSNGSINATINPANADDIGNGVVWKSSNESVATVDQNGEVTSHGKGTANITATFTNNDIYGDSSPVKEKVVGTCNVIVRNSVQSLNITPQKLIIDKKGATGRLYANIIPSYADNKSVTWSSSNTNIATVDQNGTVKGVSYGTTTIYAKSKENDQIKAYGTVKVRLEPPQFKLSTPKDKKKKVIKKAVSISWSKVSGATKYNIKRSNSPSSGFKTVKTVSSGTTKYIDKTPSHDKYYYRVEAVADDPELTSTTLTKSFTNLYPPTKIKIKVIKNKKVKVTWSKSSGATGYKIYRAVDNKKGKYKLVKTIKNGKTTKWTDKKPIMGKRNYYRIKAYKKKSGEILSNYSKYEKIYILKFRWPTGKKYRRISSNYGPRKAPTKGASTNHKGIDLIAKEKSIRGKNIYAAEAGKVTFAGWQNPKNHKAGYGRYIIIKHPNGFETRYAHNESNIVTKGEKVEKGDVIATVDSSGSSTGDHLHFEIRYNGSAKNPLKYLP